MASSRSGLKNLPVYKDARQARNALVIYHKLRPFLVNRFVVAPRLARHDGPLDRPVDTERYTIHMLSCHDDVLAMIWSLASWQAFAQDSAQVVIHEDGTFTAGDRAAVARLFPRARIIDRAASDRMARQDWLKDFPAALSRRFDRRSAYAIKLMDPLFSSQTPGVLIMDPDVLWFGTPSALHARIAQYQGAVFWPSSGEPTRQPFRDGGELRLDLAALNSGIVYFERAAFSLAMLDEYCARLPDDWKTLDQPAFAYVLGMNQPVSTLPVEQYHIHGAAHAGTLGKHYTSPRREQFWFEGVARLSKSSEFKAPR